ncbi:MAG: SRPBCC family protein [Burkholderiaceae bacterium]
MQIAAKPADIFNLYADVNGWPKWDPEVVEASLSGAFTSGAVGTIKPKGGPKSKIEFIDVKPNAAFTAQCKLPLCLMTFVHELAPNGSSTTATHSVIFSGLMAPIFGRLIGTGIKKTLPATMDGLKRAAEGGSKVR